MEGSTSCAPRFSILFGGRKGCSYREGNPTIDQVGDQVLGARSLWFCPREGHFFWFCDHRRRSARSSVGGLLLFAPKERWNRIQAVKLPRCPWRCTAWVESSRTKYQHPVSGFRSSKQVARRWPWRRRNGKVASLRHQRPPESPVSTSVWSTNTPRCIRRFLERSDKENGPPRTPFTRTAAMSDEMSASRMATSSSSGFPLPSMAKRSRIAVAQRDHQHAHWPR